MENVPALQSWQSDAASLPVVCKYLPGRQFWLPVVCMYLPGWQFWHVLFAEAPS